MGLKRVDAADLTTIFEENLCSIRIKKLEKLVIKNRFPKLAKENFQDFVSLKSRLPLYLVRVEGQGTIELRGNGGDGGGKRDEIGLGETDCNGR